MSRSLGPRTPLLPTTSLGPWFGLVLIWGGGGLLGVLWLAAHAAAALTGGRVVDFGGDFLAELIDDPAQAWPGTPSELVWTFTAISAIILATLVIIVGRWIVRRMGAPGDPVAALAHNPAIRALSGQPAAKKAIRLRAGLSGSDPAQLAPEQVGLVLGELMRPNGTGPMLHASWEDSVVAFMAPRAGKTTALSIPHVLAGPGPVVATSNKSDLWAATAELRANLGRIWLFDPQHICHQRQSFWVDLLAGLDSVEAAHRMAGHFVLTVDDGAKRDLWGPAAQDLLCALFLAAAVSGRTLYHVTQWLDQPAVPTPCEILSEAGFELLGSSLRGAQNGAVETRDGIYQTARTAAKALRDERILAWVTPPRHRFLPIFDPVACARSRDTLYLLSEDLSAASPLIAALSDTTMRAAKREAEKQGGRLDPPMVVSLDEAANICRISDLPKLYSHLGSRGIIPVTILQSYEQGQTVWGEAGMASLWGAATIKIIGAGVDSPRLTRDLATLVGQHDVPVRSLTYGERHASVQVSLRRQDILEPAAIRAMEPGTALLLATGIRPALMQLKPWYTDVYADQVTVCQSEAMRRITRGALERDERGTEPLPITGLNDLDYLP